MYKITNLVNGKFYIGKHQTKTLDDGYMGSGKLIKAAIVKYGLENFEKKILFVFDSEEKMNIKERELVVVREDSYNLVEGGHGGFGYINRNKLGNSSKNFDEIYSRVAAKNRGKKSVVSSITMKEKHKQGKIPYGIAFKGKKHSDETKRKISLANSRLVGVKNSQFGTMWITNGEINKKMPNDCVIPTGWRKGRTMRV